MPRGRKKQLQEQQEGLSRALTKAPDGLLDVKAAAAWLGVSRTILFALMKEKDFPTLRLTDRIVRFDPETLYQWALTRKDSYI